MVLQPGRLLALVLALAALLLPPWAAADPTGVSDPAATGVPAAAGYFGDAMAHGAPDGKTGAFTYTYSFALPSARGQVQPSLSLIYSSMARTREAGYGWGLDLPAIERRPMSGNPRFENDGAGTTPPGSFVGGSASDERYFFDGQALVYLCTIGQGPACPAGEKQPDWTGWRYYRLQREGMYARFYLKGDRKQWRVQLKGGATRLEFGSPDGSDDGTEYVHGDPNKIVRWRLMRQVDVRHPANVVKYKWKRLGKRGLLYLTDIFDTPKAEGQASDLDYAHHTQLSWEDHGFWQDWYADAFHATPDVRLSRVAVASKTWDASGPREVIRVYRLVYADQRGFGTYVQGTTAPLWHHSFLRQITMEGKCSHEEDGNGNIPTSAPCPTLPPTTFEYDGGGIGAFSEFVSTILPGAPANLAADNKVLPDEEVATIIDFNRDGIPDLLAPWDSGPHCWDAKGTTSVFGDGTFLICHHKGSCDDCEGFACLACEGPHTHPPMEDGGYVGDRIATRPLVGYTNRGVDSSLPLRVQLRYECMDAGYDLNVLPLPGRSPANLNAGRASAFFTAQGGATVGGAWGVGLVTWVPDSIPLFEPRPFFALPLGGVANGGCDPANFDPQSFYPAWRWVSTNHSLDWAKAGPARPGHTGTNWYTDVDGDGLVDEIVETAAAAVGDFRPGDVYFTRRFAANEPKGATTPIQRPFFFEGLTHPSLAPAENRPNTKYFYVDLNGDGLVDLVTTNSDVAGGVPRVRPGDGTGHFACDEAEQSTACSNPGDDFTPSYNITIIGADKPWPFSADTAFHDVTGDGLADIVRYEPTTGEVKVWVNLNGHSFGCVGSCVVGHFYDNVHETYNVGHHRLAFADMNADGVDDVVLIARAGVYVGRVAVVWSNPVLPAHAPRPGILVRVNNGVGATAMINYATIQELDLAAAAAGEPWRHHSRAVEPIVRRILTQDTTTANGGSLQHPYTFYRNVEYSYRDPAYDRWTRSFAGFRKVRSRVGNETAVTETTYLFGACQNDRFDAVADPNNSEQLQNSYPCIETSDDDGTNVESGLPIRVDRFIPDIPGPQGGPKKHLWTKEFFYGNGGFIDSSFVEPVTLRHVRFTPVWRIDTSLYEEDVPVQAGPTTHYPGGADPREYAPTQVGRKLVRHEWVTDRQGNILKVADRGTSSEESDTQTATIYGMYANLHLLDEPHSPPAEIPCTADWQCNPTYATTFGTFADGTQRKTQHVKFTYEDPTTNSGAVTAIEGFLEDAQVLVRQHVAGSAVAPSPPDQSARGWRTLATFSYDTFGNLTQSVRGPHTTAPICATVSYDGPYQHLPALSVTYPNGCGTPGLETTVIYFDRGFEVPTWVVEPSLATTTTELDWFGRVQYVFAPAPDAPDPSFTTRVLAVAYTDQSPVSTVDVIRYLQASSTLRSVSILNGLGEVVASAEQRSGTSWVIQGWTETDSAGRPFIVRWPAAFPGDPVATALAGGGLSKSSQYFEADYDSFGRLSSIFENTPAFGPVKIVRREFHPLKVKTRDAEQLKAGGPHALSYTEQFFDGHGRVKRTVQYTSGPTLATKVDYYPTGEPRLVWRSGYAAPPVYERSFAFDTLGRLVLNDEPNTGHGWRYAYDDAGRIVGTSDARGCGKNLYYDGLGRVLGEDFSPCLASHPPYTPPNLDTGEGLEAFYRYDVYEPGQIEAEPGFPENTRYGAGHLVSVRDRGSHTRFNFDSRGRVRRTSRQIAKPAAFAATGTSMYAQHWFKSRVDYDLANRMTRRTTGADIAELLAGGASEETYLYGERGLPLAVSSSYGGLINGFVYDILGNVTSISYDDIAGTQATFERDDRQRLTRYKISRVAAPALWSAPPMSTYSQPPASTKPLVIADYRFLQYDDVGNPGRIEDQATLSVPEHALPQKSRTVAYDDLYRVTEVAYTYSTPSGAAAWQSPYDPEIAAGDRRPIPLRAASTRVRSQTFGYDEQGNTTYARDEAYLSFDRSLGASNLTYGSPSNGPNQLRAADGLQVQYDAAGHLVELKLERAGSCPDGTGDRCSQWFAYDWDEVGQLVRAQRWDFEGSSLPVLPPGTLPAEAPTWDLSYAYTMGLRVLKSAKDPTGVEKHTLDVFGTLRLERTGYLEASEAYDRDRDRLRLYLAGGSAMVFYDSAGALPRPKPASPPLHVYFHLGDHLGSASATIDRASGELVERATYQAFGALESDFRPDRWARSHESFKFTGKEEDIEVGATYFGARYYHAHLGRWMSADPLTIHALGSDLNPYVYVSGRVMTYVDPFGLWKCGGCGREVPDDEVHIHPPDWSRTHAKDMANATEHGGWWHKNTVTRIARGTFAQTGPGKVVNIVDNLRNPGATAKGVARGFGRSGTRTVVNRIVPPLAGPLYQYIVASFDPGAMVANAILPPNPNDPGEVAGAGIEEGFTHIASIIFAVAGGGGGGPPRGPGAGGGGPTPLRFAHGTSLSSAQSITRPGGGLSAAEALANTKGGTALTHGSFFAHEIGPPTAPGGGLQMAYEWGFRHSPTPVVVIGELPGPVAQGLLESGGLQVMKVPGMPGVQQLVFGPSAFGVVNQNVIWLKILRP
jgi:RHS repeat-associated protein